VSDRFAILAGGGTLPALIAEGARERGQQAHIVAIEGEADPVIVGRFPHTWVNWGGIGRMVRTIKAEGGSAMVIAGSVTRPDLMRIRPDLGFFRSLPSVIGTLAKGGDDGVLSHVVRFFERNGIVVRGLDEVAPELLISEGQPTLVRALPRDESDIALALDLLGALGPLDVGQGAVVRAGRIIAIEGVEGTDRMLDRAAELIGLCAAAPPAGVLVKAPKPGQEMRVDMPTLGPRTVDNAARAGLAGIAGIASAALLLDRADAVASANAKGLFIIGLKRSARPYIRAVDPARSGPKPHALMTRRAPPKSSLADCDRAVAAVTAVARYVPGAAAVVARRHVLAVSAAEEPLAMVERVGRFKPWRLGGLEHRRGVIAIDCASAEPSIDADALLAAATAAGLAGIVAVGRGAMGLADTLADHRRNDDLFVVAASAPSS
jgi:DUF1009 family protein